MTETDEVIKKRSFKEDIFLNDSIGRDDDNRTARFLSKVNAHITSNLNKGLKESNHGKWIFF